MVAEAAKTLSARVAALVAWRVHPKPDASTRRVRVAATAEKDHPALGAGFPHIWYAIGAPSVKASPTSH